MDKDTIIVEARNEAESVVIWLHGLGADGHDFEPLVPALQLPSTRFVFPNAPVSVVTINGGNEMRSWYDIVSMDFSTAGNVDDMKRSTNTLNDLIDLQIQSGIGADKIVVAGFSQGGVIALLAGLTGTQNVAGILALSTYLPEQLRTPDWTSRPAVLMCHGRQDPVIPFSLAQASSAYMSETGIDIQFQAYDMQHQVIEDEVSLIRSWLHAKLIP